MPFINTKFSGAISDAEQNEIKSALGKAVSVLGKSESWLMVGFEENCPLFFKGEKCQKAAFVEVSLFGNASAAAYDKFTGEVCNILGNSLKIPADKIYVKYSPTEHWGWNGGNF